MRAQGTAGYVARRAGRQRSVAVALVLSVVVICTLVTALVSALDTLTESALRRSTAAIERDRTVVQVTARYDLDDPSAQDRAVRDALAGVLEPLGGSVVSGAEGVVHDLLGNRVAATGEDVFAFGVLRDADDRLALSAGRFARPAPRPEVAVPRAVADRFGLGLGDRMRLRNRDDGTLVRPVVVGIWEPPAAEQLRWLEGLVTPAPGDPAGTDPDAVKRWGPLLTTPDVFASAAGPLPKVRWRAVPDIDRLTPEQISTMAVAAENLRTRLHTAAEQTGTGALPTVNRLPEVLGGLQRTVTLFRSLLLVPAVLLLILGLFGVTMVAALLADVRGPEADLLRSRGASEWQLVRPTLVESLGCGVVGAVAAPVLSSRIGLAGTADLVGSTWLAAGLTGAACSAALALPGLARAVSRAGDRAGDRTGLTALRRRRRLTVAAFGTLLLAALCVVAVSQLLRYESVAAGDGVSVDPLLVASPGLVLVCGCSFLAVLTVLVVRVLARVLSRGRRLPAHLATRTVARAAASALPLMLVIASGTAIVWVANLQLASQLDARESRATHVVGADLHLTEAGGPPGGSLERARSLRLTRGVAGAMPVRPATFFVGAGAVDVLLADLPDATGTGLDPAGYDHAPPAPTLRRLVDRGWSSAGGGVMLPTGTRQVVLTFDNPRVVLRVSALLADPNGTVLSATATPLGRRQMVIRWPKGLHAPHRLVGLEAAVHFRACQPEIAGIEIITVEEVSVDGHPRNPDVRWTAREAPLSPAIVHNCLHGALTDRVGLLGDDSAAAADVPAAVTETFARRADVAVGDVITVTISGARIGLRVVDVLPLLAGVADDRGGILVDRSTAARALLIAGQSVEPTDWWVTIDPRSTDPTAVTAAVRRTLAEDAVVTTRAAVLDDLAEDPGTGGSGLPAALRWTSAAGVAVCLLLVAAAGLLRRGERARTAGVLRMLGSKQRTLLATIAGEYALTAGVGAVVGAAVGWGVTALVLPVVTLGPGGSPLVPAVVLTTPWLVVLPITAVLVLLPLLLVLVLARSDAASATVADLRAREHIGAV